MKENRVIVCAGSGGVGKTTISAALAVRASHIGLRTLVLTVDPAKRLATALGLDLSDDRPRAVSVQSAEGDGKLAAAVIDSKKTFDQFIRAHAKQAEIVERIMKNRLYQEMSTTLAGSQEFTALERLLQEVEGGTYDLVILDTPPTKHAMDFLTAPQRINSLFQDAITKWFMSPSEKAPGFLASLVGKGTRTVLRSLEALTGAEFIDELIDFFSAVRSIQGVLRDRSRAVHELLTGTKTKFVVVTSFDAAKLLEAKYLRRELRRLGYTMEGVVINRAFPDWMPRELSRRSGTREEVGDPAYQNVRDFFARFKVYHSIRYNLFDEFAAELDKDVLLMRVPEYQQDIHGMADLEALAEVLATNGGLNRGKA